MTIACELDDLSVLEMPVDPELEAMQIRSVAARIVVALHTGEGCLVHCAAGRGRTGTVLGVALRMLGIQADRIVELLDALHVLRSGKGWPEAEWQKSVIFATQPL